MYYKYHKINLYSGVKYVNYTKWIKKTINFTSKKYKKHFQYTVTVALILGEIKKYLQRITQIKPFMNKYNWERKYFPSEKDDWKKIEKNNVTYILLKIYPAYVSKHNWNREKEDINFFILIPSWERWHYLAIKNYQHCLNCLFSFTTGNKRKSHKNVCENKNFCNFVMPSEDNEIL